MRHFPKKVNFKFFFQKNVLRFLSLRYSADFRCSRLVSVDLLSVRSNSSCTFCTAVGTPITQSKSSSKDSPPSATEPEEGAGGSPLPALFPVIAIEMRSGEDLPRRPIPLEPETQSSIRPCLHPSLAVEVWARMRTSGVPILSTDRLPVMCCP